MRFFSITFVIAGLIAFAVANDQFNKHRCTDDGCKDFYDGKVDNTPAPIVKIEPFFSGISLYQSGTTEMAAFTFAVL